MSTADVVVGCLLALLLLLVLASCLLRANRLDRLHVRTDAARAALLASLERRAVVARAVALQLGDPLLRTVASATEAALGDEREAAENDLSALLGKLHRDGLPEALCAELVDVEQRIMIARQVHNDVVRDTRALRSRRLVRWLRLAGNAPAPAYFDIVDAEPATDDAPVRLPRRRRAGRALLIDYGGRVLLFEGFDPARPGERFWFTPGGGVEPGESTLGAAVRELAEETGLRLPVEQLVGPVWRREVLVTLGGERVAEEEEFFVARAQLEVVDTSGFTQLEVDTVLGYRWWTEDELRRTDAVIFPRDLGGLVGEFTGGGWDGVTRCVS
jgi:8-oxo-dGTP pyrophosphatase MutT (NUDIX family)